MDVHHRVHRAEQDFTRRFIVIDEGLRQHALIARGAIHRNGGGVFHAVEAENTGFDRHPLQAMHQPARGDAGHLRRGFGCICKLPRGDVAKGRGGREMFAHKLLSVCLDGCGEWRLDAVFGYESFSPIGMIKII